MCGGAGGHNVATMTSRTTHTRTALITGASRGLGLALAHGLVAEGYTLIVDARDATALDEAVTGLPPGALVHAIAGDVTDPAHRAALRDAAGLPVGTPAFGTGMRCYAWYNRQSGRWEIMAPALCVVWIELTATFTPGDSSVTAGLIDNVDEPEITVYVEPADFHGVGRAGSGTYAHAGTLGYRHIQFARTEGFGDILLLPAGREQHLVDRGKVHSLLAGVVDELREIRVDVYGKILNHCSPCPSESGEATRP